MNEQRYSFPWVVRHLIIIGVIVGIVLFIRALSDVLIPFFIALVLAYMMDPYVNRVQRLIKHRGLAVIATFIVLITAAIGVFMIAAPMISDEAHMFGDLMKRELPNLKHRIGTEGTLRRIVDALGGIDPQRYLTMDNLLATARKVMPGFWSGVGNIFGWMLGLIGLFTTVIYVIFMLIDHQKMKGRWQEFIPERYREGLIELLQDTTVAMNTYFRGQFKIAGILTIVYIAGFVIIGLPLAILLGLLAGILNLIPYFGVLSIVPVGFSAALLSMETGTGFWMIMLWVLIVYVVAQALEGLVLTPKIQGESSGLSPAVIILSLSIWGSLLGLLGLILAIPFTSLLISYYRRFLRDWDAQRGGKPMGSRKS